MTSSEIPPLVIPYSFLTHVLARVRVADLVRYLRVRQHYVSIIHPFRQHFQ